MRNQRRKRRILAEYEPPELGLLETDWDSARLTGTLTPPIDICS